MMFNRLPKIASQVGSVLLLSGMLSMAPITAYTAPYKTFKQTNIEDNDKNKINLNLLAGKINWSEMSKDEKKQLQSELKQLVSGLKEANQECKKEFGKDLFSNELINKITKFANKPEKFDEKVIESLVEELLGSAFGLITMAWEGENNPLKTLFSSEQKKPTKKKTPAPAKKHAYYNLTENMITVAPIPYNNGTPNSYIKSVTIEKDATKVTFVNAIHFPSNWSQFSSTAYLRDLKTDKRYYPIGMEKNIPLDSLLVTKGHARQMVEFTLIYPPLDRKTKEILYCNKSSEKFERPTNGSERQNTLIKLEQFKPQKKRLIIRELLNGKFALCSAKGYWLNSSNFDRIETFKRKGELFYTCYSNGNVWIYNSSGQKM